MQQNPYIVELAEYKIETKTFKQIIAEIAEFFYDEFCQQRESQIEVASLSNSERSA